MAFVTSFLPRTRTAPRAATSARRRAPPRASASASFDDFYPARPSIAVDSPPPDEDLYAEYYDPATLHFAPEISVSFEKGAISVASAEVKLLAPGDLPAATPASAAYAGGPDPALWEAYYPKSRVNYAPHIAIVPGESVSVSNMVVAADVERAQQSVRTDAPFESGWSAGWRPASRWSS